MKSILLACSAICLLAGFGFLGCKSDTSGGVSASNDESPPVVSEAAITAADSRFDERLFRAAQRGSRAVVSSRLDDGVAINAPNPENGWTALHAAAYNGHKKLVAYLLTRGASPNTQDHDGNTPLHLAASLGHDDTTVALIGVTDLRLRNKAGKTPREVSNPRLTGFFPSNEP